MLLLHSRAAPHVFDKMMNMGQLYFLSSFFSLLLLQPTQIHSQTQQICNQTDLNSLKSFSNGLDDPILAWNFTNSTTTLSNCCNWTGITCDYSTSYFNARVIGLDLFNKSLKGSISDSLAGLDRLKRLNLSCNSLHGSVPSQLFRLDYLEILDLSVNSLSGVIPLDMNLPAIQVFNISFNQFNGSHPIFASSRNLIVLDLSSNAFYGPIDTRICESSARVKVLRFSTNSFASNLPIGFGNCTSLSELWLDGNGLSGNLPDDLLMMSSLMQLSLLGNSLSGKLSPKISNLSNIVYLDLSFNNFSGPIPDIFDRLNKLESFFTISNKLTGVLPPSLSNCSALKVLNLRDNSLRGPINLNFTSLPVLTILDLGVNQFTGFIPSDLPNCVNMTSLNLGRNNLVGEIPLSFRNFTSITYLSLTGNNFTNVSSALQILQFLPNLATLVLTKNFLEGEPLPSIDRITGFSKIQVFVLANCALSGLIPPWLQNLGNLKVLDISWNRFVGQIPPWIGQFDQLFYLDLSNNSLSGEIPTELTQLKGLSSTNLSHQVDSMQNFPFFIKKNSSQQGLQYNQASSFPPSIFLAHNDLYGPIPPSFGLLVGLLNLDLSYNHLSGSIPDQLSDMYNLESLELSHNNLTGNIPSSLTKLTFLSLFDVAYNNLTGEIPTGGQFYTFSRKYFEGNPGLCGIHLSPCESNYSSNSESHKSHRASKSVIIGIATGLGVGSGIIIVLILLFMARMQIEKEEKVAAVGDEFVDPSGPSELVILFHNKENEKWELSIDDILLSTNNFDQEYIIGCGGFGLVYKATLPDSRRVAIKRLSGDFVQMEREFRAEVETLSRAQHKNLVPLQGYAKFGNNRLLIYSFMENSSLDYWLHEREEEDWVLDWEKRVQIVRGAARGLAYLHNSCEPRILHRDIKSSNILLDENFEAHLADFGLARLVLDQNTHVTTDVVGTLGYIPPEYGHLSQATYRGDMYSFGIVILEILTGRRPVDMCKRETRDVVPWVRRMREEEREEEIFYSKIYDREKGHEFVRLLDIACLCVSEDPKSRPSSQQLVEWLDDISNNRE